MHDLLEWSLRLLRLDLCFWSVWALIFYCLNVLDLHCRWGWLISSHCFCQFLWGDVWFIIINI